MTTSKAEKPKAESPKATSELLNLYTSESFLLSPLRGAGSLRTAAPEQKKGKEAQSLEAYANASKVSQRRLSPLSSRDSGAPRDPKVPSEAAERSRSTTSEEQGEPNRTTTIKNQVANQIIREDDHGGRRTRGPRNRVEKTKCQRRQLETRTRDAMGGIANHEDYGNQRRRPWRSPNQRVTASRRWRRLEPGTRLAIARSAIAANLSLATMARNVAAIASDLGLAVWQVVVAAIAT
ncbi:hypothetical protein U1Q18_038965 [Sarracenia purpurea var. burkii]